MQARHDTLGTLYRDHQPWLRNWLAGRLGCREVAADLAQDTFARLLFNRDLSGLHEPRAFLTTVAKGLLANWYRRQSLERAYLESLAALPEGCMPSAEQQVLVREALNQIDAMLDGLPAQARRVFLLSQLDGLGYAEIAGQLGISLSTVKRHMKRAFLGCLAHAP
ncbi:MAG: sigma-70 family RNA polymerase sigma factor [Pseudomonas sp.]